METIDEPTAPKIPPRIRALATLLVGVAIGSAFTWMLVRPQPTDRVSFHVVRGSAIFSGDAMALDIEEGDRGAFFQPGDGSVGLSLEISGMDCVPDRLKSVPVVVGVVHTESTDPFPGGDQVLWVTSPGATSLCP